MNFNMENIELFLTVFDTGSFSTAARKIHLVPSAVRTALSKDNQDICDPLFERKYRKRHP
ncbi:LysR family transcriptional regulator, partial [Acinetobacter baumannii]|nr:LysR family transcriptional regulator [Acinetobacter baumannii]